MLVFYASSQHTQATVALALCTPYGRMKWDKNRIVKLAVERRIYQDRALTTLLVKSIELNELSNSILILEVSTPWSSGSGNKARYMQSPAELRKPLLWRSFPCNTVLLPYFVRRSSTGAA